jgi:hypothetical protein
MTVYTLFGQPASPAALTSDTGDYTMGMQFTLSQAAPLTGIWFNSAAGAGALPAACCIYQITGTNTGSQVTGTVNNSPSWSGAAGSGWVKCTYPGTTTLAASTNYRVCVFYGGGANWYSTTANYWSSGPGSGGLASGIISAPAAASADGGNQDAFKNPSAALGYPTSSFNSSNYWIDVEVTTAGPAPGPNVVSLLAPGAGGISGWVMLPARGRAGSAV